MVLLGMIGVALLAGTCTFFLIKLVRLTFGAIKKRIVERLKKKPGEIPLTGEAVVWVEELLKSAPTVKLSDLGDDVQMDDVLMVGMMEDGSLDVEVDNFRAKEIDEQLQQALQTSGAIKIDCRG